AAETDVKRPPDYGSLHRFRRIGGHACVAPDAVNGQRAKPYTVDAVFQKVDSRVVFVAAFERAVMRVHPTGLALGHRVVALSEDGGGTGVGDPVDAPAGIFSGLEDINRADDINHCAQARVGATGRNLQSGQVNDVSDLAPLDDLSNPGAISNVARDEDRPPDFVIVHD